MALIINEKDLQESWKNKSVNFWVVNDGVGDMRYIYREDAVLYMS